MPGGAAERLLRRARAALAPRVAGSSEIRRANIRTSSRISPGAPRGVVVARDPAERAPADLAEAVEIAGRRASSPGPPRSPRGGRRGSAAGRAARGAQGPRGGALSGWRGSTGRPPATSSAGCHSASGVGRGGCSRHGYGRLMHAACDSQPEHRSQRCLRAGTVRGRHHPLHAHPGAALQRRDPPQRLRDRGLGFDVAAQPAELARDVVVAVHRAATARTALRATSAAARRSISQPSSGTVARPTW